MVPVYDVERWLPESLDSLLGQDGVDLQVVVVDDGSPDGSGEIADGYAARDDRVTVLHVPTAAWARPATSAPSGSTGDYLAFLDSDDVLPPGALATLAGTLADSGSDFVTGSIVRWEADGLHEPPWMRRLHQRRTGITAREHPEILGDVFAWNKLFRTSFWREQGLEWPEGVRYEDQPTTTRAYLAGTFDVVPDVVYHWRIRQDGISITQQRASVDRPDATAGGPSGWPSTPCRSTTTRARRRTSSTACWPATCTATSSRSPTRPTSGGGCWSTGSATCGASGRWCTAGCRPCTGSSAGWSSRTAAPMPSRSCGGS